MTTDRIETIARTETAPAAPTTPRAEAGLREMDEGEIRLHLHGHTWGVLATIHQGRPYAVPVSFGFDGTYLYIATGPGRKLRALSESPAACLTIADVTDGSRWNSVVVMADVEPVDSIAVKLHGLNTIRRQQSGGGLTSAKDLARAASATLFRLAPTEVSGRVRR